MGAVSHIIRHYLPQAALVHIYIPQIRTPCGCRLALGDWAGLTSLSWASVLSVASLYLTSILYHTSGILSRGFSKVFEKFFRGYQPFRGRFSLTRPLTLIVYHISGRMSIVKIHKLSIKYLCISHNKAKTSRHDRRRDGERKRIRKRLIPCSP